MRVLAVANQKGGTGKTATAAALAHLLATNGRHVLAVDCDPQASLSGALGVTDARGRSMAEVMGGPTAGALGMADIAIPVAPGLDLAPADIALANAEMGLTPRLGRELVLRRALATVSDRYTLAILDCGPALGLLTINALTAADAVIIPSRPEGADLRGIALFLDTLSMIRGELNPGLQILGVILTQFDPRVGHHADALAVLANGPVPLLGTVPRSIRVAESMALQEPLHAFAPGHPTAEAYSRLAETISEWLRSPTQSATR